MKREVRSEAPETGTSGSPNQEPQLLPRVPQTSPGAWVQVRGISLGCLQRPAWLQPEDRWPAALRSLGQQVAVPQWPGARSLDSPEPQPVPAGLAHSCASSTWLRAEPHHPQESPAPRQHRRLSLLPSVPKQTEAAQGAGTAHSGSQTLAFGVPSSAPLGQGAASERCFLIGEMD